MKIEEFNQLVKKRFDTCLNVMGLKSLEYSSDTDKLHNFKRASEIAGGTPQEALWGMLLKHIISIQDIVKSGKVPSPAVMDEKFTDAINYLLLLEGIFSEK